MNSEKYKYLPEVNCGGTINSKPNIESDTIGNSPCPCCRFITIPNNGDALAYICPICLWEIDFFIHSDDEASDQNHGLTLVEARKIINSLEQYCPT